MQKIISGILLLALAFPLTALTAENPQDSQQNFEAVKAKRLDLIDLRIESLNRQKSCVNNAQGLADIEQCNKERKQELTQKKLNKIETQKQSLEKR